MDGPLPLSLSRLTSMEELMMDKNDFSGDITTVFQSMPLLQFLFLGDNQLKATMDDRFLSSNPNLTQIDISINNMVGVLPQHFFDGLSMPNLQMLDLHDNILSGVLPENVPRNDVLRFVALNENSITGSIPISWTQNLTNLYHLDLSSNQLEGPMTPEIGDMTNLQFLALGDNPFDVGPIPPSFANLTKMQEFSVMITNRQGGIPDFIGSSWSELRLLDLNENELQGFIPDSLGNLKQLEFLFLNRNQLIGQIPKSLMNLINLRAAFLESNELTGDLDSTLCQLPGFRFSHLNDSDALLVADCIGDLNFEREQSRHQQPVTCRCCKVCCVVGDVDCHNRNIYPNWENNGYNDFGNATRFVNRNYINIERTSQ
jgi:Leucine-rich repeat (LRR) protein